MRAHASESRRKIDVQHFVRIGRRGINGREQLDPVGFKPRFLFQLSLGADARVFAPLALARGNLYRILPVRITELRNKVYETFVIHGEHSRAAAVPYVFALGRFTVGKDDIVAIHLHYSAVVDKLRRRCLFLEIALVHVIS